MSPDPPELPIKRSLGLALRVAQVRLRMIAVLVVAFLVVSQWETIRNRWDKFANWVGRTKTDQSISSDTEYFCPMDPGVVSNWPNKCGICNMALVRRKKGDVVPLPDGVIARMQFSPYRLQLAGIQTTPAAYQPLAREVVLTGKIESAERGSTSLVTLRPDTGNIPDIAPGMAVEVCRETPLGDRRDKGAIRSVGKETGHDDQHLVSLEMDDPECEVKAGITASVRVVLPIAQVEPFRSMPTRTALQHAPVIAGASGTVAAPGGSAGIA